MNYTKRVFENLKEKNLSEPEFLQAVKEVFDSVKPFIESMPNYEKEAMLERITEPDRQIKFRVTWIDDNGHAHVNTGYRVQFNNALGPYKGGIRFHPSVNMGIMKFLSFEQIFKNALTGLPIGGGKGGSDFNPKGKSDREIMAFCQSYMTELFRYIGPNTDVPAGDIGVGAKEIGYFFGQYKRLKNEFTGVFTGKGLLYGGSLARKEATGYGLLYLTNQMLKSNGYELQGKTICISGSGNVAIHAAEKAVELGAKVLTMSDSTGWIYDKNGIDINIIKGIKEKNKQRLYEYKNLKKDSQYFSGTFLWDIPCNIALPCATQNELGETAAKNLVKNNILAVAEGANMPTVPLAIEIFQKNNILFMPGKAANSGGVATSALEMSQNSLRLNWSFEEVDQKLQTIMTNIFKTISSASVEYGNAKNYILGANIAGFKKVSQAMIDQGII